MIALTCAGCGKAYQLNDDAAGRRLKCGACGNINHVPESSAAPAPAPTPDPVASAGEDAFWDEINAMDQASQTQAELGATGAGGGFKRKQRKQPKPAAGSGVVAGGLGRGGSATWSSEYRHGSPILAQVMLLGWVVALVYEVHVLRTDGQVPWGVLLKLFGTSLPLLLFVTAPLLMCGVLLTERMMHFRVTTNPYLNTVAWMGTPLVFSMLGLFLARNMPDESGDMDFAVFVSFCIVGVLAVFPVFWKSYGLQLLEAIVGFVLTLVVGIPACLIAWLVLGLVIGGVMGATGWQPGSGDDHKSAARFANQSQRAGLNNQSLPLRRSAEGTQKAKVIPLFDKAKAVFGETDPDPVHIAQAARWLTSANLPDAQPPLTEAQKQTAIEWLAKQLAAEKCPSEVLGALLSLAPDQKDLWLTHARQATSAPLVQAAIRNTALLPAGQWPPATEAWVNVLVKEVKTTGAVRLLQAMGPAAKPAILAGLARTSRASEQVLLLDLLSKCGDAGDVGAIEHLLASRDDQVVAQAQKTVAQLDPESDAALLVLVGKLQNRSIFVQEEALNALALLPVDPQRQEQIAGLLFGIALHSQGQAEQLAIAQLDKWRTEATAEQALAVLKSGNVFDKRKAAQMLGNWQVSEAIPALVQFMVDDHFHSTDPLIAMGPAAEDAVLPYLRSSEAFVPDRVIKVLMVIGTDKSVQALANMAKRARWQRDAQEYMNAAQAIRTRMRAERTNR